MFIMTDVKSLCDTCHSPGACCKNFSLGRTFWFDGDDTVELFLKSNDFPFVPILVEEHESEKKGGRKYGSYRFSCPKLTAEGRCSIYEDRPYVCRQYEPASSSLCVYFEKEKDSE